MDVNAGRAGVSPNRRTENVLGEVSSLAWPFLKFYLRTTCVITHHSTLFGHKEQVPKPRAYRARLSSYHRLLLQALLRTRLSCPVPNTTAVDLAKSDAYTRAIGSG